MSWNNEEIRRLVGRTIKHIYMNEKYLKFETDLGNIVFGVWGDCCSHSYFHDFIGVEKLLNGNPVVSVSAIALNTSDSKVPVNRNDDDDLSDEQYERADQLLYELPIALNRILKIDEKKETTL